MNVIKLLTIISTMQYMSALTFRCCCRCTDQPLTCVLHLCCIGAPPLRGIASQNPVSLMRDSAGRAALCMASTFCVHKTTVQWNACTLETVQLLWNVLFPSPAIFRQGLLGFLFLSCIWILFRAQAPPRNCSHCLDISEIITSQLRRLFREVVFLRGFDCGLPSWS